MDNSELEPDNNSLRERERKPHNYYNDLTPAQKEEHDKNDAHAVEVKKISDLRESQGIYEKIAKTFSNIDNGNGESKKQRQEEDDEELASIRLTNDDIDFMFDTMTKEAKYDRLSVKQLFFGMISTFTKLPIPHVVNSRDTGAGKSYLLNHVASYFPDRYKTLLAGTSEKTMFHKDGIMVYEDENHDIKPIHPAIVDLQFRIEELQADIDKQNELKKNHKPFDDNLTKSNKKQIAEIEERIKTIRNSAQKLIDVNNQIIIYQDTPPQNMISFIMSLLSQDSTQDQLYTFVEKRNGELTEKKNRIRGTPNLFYTQVIDDTHHQRYEEKNRRFIHITPDTTEQKIDSACDLICDDLGLTDEEYDEDIVSEEDKRRARHTVGVIIAKLRTHNKYFESKKAGVRVPFQKAIANSIPIDRRDVWRMTATNRVMRYLIMITKINMDQRPKVRYKSGKEYIISTFDDVAQVLELVQRVTSKMRPYQEDWFYNVFVPVYQDQKDEPKFEYNEIGMKVSEIVIGVTTEELAAKTAEVLKSSKPSTEQIRKKYLDSLVNIGLVNKHDSRIRLHTNIYSPVDETAIKRDNIEKFKVRNIEVFPYKDYLEHSLRRIVTHGEDGADNIEGNGERVILSPEGQELSVNELVYRYLSGAERVFTL